MEESEISSENENEVTGSRRHLLRLGAAGAVAAAAALVAGAASSPEAKAANGGNFILGAGNSATLDTVLTGSAGSMYVLDVQATFGSSVAVMGSAQGSFSTGVFGVSHKKSGSGISGVAYGSKSFGVTAATYSGSSTGLSVVASGAKSIGIYSNCPSGPSLILDPVASGVTVPPTAGSYSTGAFMVDTSGHIWYCVKGGTPGTWIKLSGTFIPLNPSVRAYDSRTSSGGPGPLNAGATATVSLNVTGGVPKGASAALVNLTIVDTQGAGGYLTLYAANASNPGTSNINWSSPGTILANNATVAVDPNAAINVYAGNQSTDFIIDILGYYL
jgi:hypothetical protein